MSYTFDAQETHTQVVLEVARGKPQTVHSIPLVNGSAFTSFVTWVSEEKQSHPQRRRRLKKQRGVRDDNNNNNDEDVSQDDESLPSKDVR